MATGTASGRSGGARRLRRIGVIGGVIAALAAFRARTIGAHEQRLPHVVDRRIPPPGAPGSNGKAAAAAAPAPPAS